MAEKKAKLLNIQDSCDKWLQTYEIPGKYRTTYKRMFSCLEEVRPPVTIYDSRFFEKKSEVLNDFLRARGLNLPGWRLTNLIEVGGESAFFKVVLLNEFLTQDTYQTLGEFMDSEWNEIYRKMSNFELSIHNYSEKLFTVYWSQNPLNIQLAGRSALRELQRSYTKADVVTLLTATQITIKGDIVEPVEVILGRKKKREDISSAQLFNKLMFYAGRNALDGSEAKRSPLEWLTLLQDLYIQTRVLVYETTSKGAMTSGFVSTNDFNDFMDKFFEREKLSFKHFALFLTLVKNPTKLWRSGGNSKNVFEFYEKVFTFPHDEIGSVLEFIHSSVHGYYGTKPTRAEWFSALEEGLLWGDPKDMIPLFASDKRVIKRKRA